MEVGHTHARLLRQGLDVQPLLIAAMDFADGARHFSEMSLCAKCCAHRSALLTGDDAVIDFSHQRRTEDLRVDRMTHGFDKAQC